MRNKKFGFTLIELLVVIAIIGVLSTLAVVALNSAREKARDAKRISDVKQIQTALELYYSDQGNYPTQVTAITLGAGTDCSSAVCGTLSSTNGWASTVAGTTYMGQVPFDPGPSTIYEYTSADGTDFSISFTLEGQTGGLTAPDCIASTNGIVCTGTF